MDVQNIWGIQVNSILVKNSNKTESTWHLQLSQQA